MTGIICAEITWLVLFFLSLFLGTADEEDNSPRNTISFWLIMLCFPILTVAILLVGGGYIAYLFYIDYLFIGINNTLNNPATAREVYALGFW